MQLGIGDKPDHRTHKKHFLYLAFGAIFLLGVVGIIGKVSAGSQQEGADVLRASSWMSAESLAAHKSFVNGAPQQ